MKRLIYYVAILAIVMSATCVAGASSGVIDFESYVWHSGEWSVVLDSDPPEVIQNRPTGGIARFLFLGEEVGERFVVSAEFGAISGDRVDERPYFGLIFNKQYKGAGGSRIEGYQFTFRPSQFQYELVKVRLSGTELLRSHVDVMPWAWGLEQWRTLKVVRDGALIECYVDDELIISYEDAEFTGGYVGFWTYSTAAVFRNIKYEPLE